MALHIIENYRNITPTQETLLETTEKKHNSQHSNQKREKIKQGLHNTHMIEYRDMHLYVLLFYSRHFFCGSLNRRHFGASSYPGSHSPPLVRLSDQLDLSRRHPVTEIHGNIHG